MKQSTPFRPLLMLLAALTVSDANVHAASGCEDLSSIPIRYHLQWPQVWQAINDGPGCTQNCHNGTVPTGDLDFSSQTLSIYFLVTQYSSQNPTQFRVDPGHPKSSLLLQKVNCMQPDVGQRMPPGGHVSLDLQAMLYDWIASGAYGESSEDPIPRNYLFSDGLESERR
jgi:hypothetical protein